MTFLLFFFSHTQYFVQVFLNVEIKQTSYICIAPNFNVQGRIKLNEK